MQRTTLFAILQQNEYEYPAFADWYQRHKDSRLTIKPEKWTPKLKILRVLVQHIFFLPLLWRFRLALMSIQPFEALLRQLTYRKAFYKLASYRKNGLVVVAIAGSYAKTSTKHILAHMLSETHTVSITPKSINTPLGIARFVENQLGPEHQVFIVELGEYYQGDIRQLAEWVQPDFGIVTPIGRQHLERMGSLEAIAHTIGELLEFFDYSPQKTLVHENNRRFFSEKAKSLTYYGSAPQSDYQVTAATVDARGTHFNLVLPDKTIEHVYSPLFGEHQAVNLLPAFWLGRQLGIDPQLMATHTSKLPAIPRRHEPTFAANNVLILDNSYNTNPDAIQASFKLIEQIKHSACFFITAGFQELGSQAEALNKELGAELAKRVDYVAILHSPLQNVIRQGFLEAGGKPSQVTTSESHEAAVAAFHDKIVPGSLLIFEGGYKEAMQ